jgi:acyl carrier protein
MSNAELIIRTCMAEQCEGSELKLASIDLDRSLFEYYGLTSLNMISLLMNVCEQAGIQLSEFAEQDLASFKTPRDIVGAVTNLRRSA